MTKDNKRLHNDVSFCSAIYKVLGKVQTDLCFEKPKFHFKILKQNLGQNIKKMDLKL